MAMPEMNAPCPLPPAAAPPRPADAPPGAVWLAASADIAEGAEPLHFGLRLWGREDDAFVLRLDTRLAAYVNRCAHEPSRMEGSLGELFDETGRYIVCSVHGATYEAASGHCIAGPCRGESLIAIDVFEHAGHVYWWPTPDLQPLAAEQP